MGMRKQNRRWIDCNSHLGDSLLGTIGYTQIFVPPGQPRELLVGDLDMDWSDKSEVTVQRILGNLSLWMLSETDPDNGGTAFPEPVLVRFGLLATEDTDRLYQDIDLGDPESLEEYEWMWLNQTTAEFNWQYEEPSGVRRATATANYDVDVITKRKLGKKDSIVLYSQLWMQSAAPQAFNVTARYSYQLRAVLT